jgi:hypothetical protein
MARKRMIVAATMAVGLFAACDRSNPSPHMSLTSLEPLRSAFNADSGKVRAIFLASPT